MLDYSYSESYGSSDSSYPKQLRLTIKETSGKGVTMTLLKLQNHKREFTGTRKYFGSRSQLTNCILDSGETCHMTPDISDFILGSLVEIDKYIEVVFGHFFIPKQTGEYQINFY